MYFVYFECSSKDCITITDNLVYDHNDTSEIPDLETFKQKLLEECLRRSFFQNEPMKIYNMLKLPLIIAPSLLREQVNTDIKESIVTLFLL